MIRIRTTFKQLGHGYVLSENVARHYLGMCNVYTSPIDSRTCISLALYIYTFFLILYMFAHMQMQTRACTRACLLACLSVCRCICLCLCACCLCLSASVRLYACVCMLWTWRIHICAHKRRGAHVYLYRCTFACMLEFHAM